MVSKKIDDYGERQYPSELKTIVFAYMCLESKRSKSIESSLPDEVPNLSARETHL